MRQKQPTTQTVEPEPFWDTPTLFTTRLDYTNAHVRANIKEGVTAKLRKEKFSLANKRSPNIYIITYNDRWVKIYHTCSIHVHV